MRENEIRNLLQQWADRIDRQVASLRHELGLLGANDIDLRTADLDLLARLEEERIDVSMAFERLAGGDYGHCLECGEPITEACVRHAPHDALCQRHRALMV